MFLSQFPLLFLCMRKYQQLYLKESGCCPHAALFAFVERGKHIFVQPKTHLRMFMFVSNNCKQDVCCGSRKKKKSL